MLRPDRVKEPSLTNWSYSGSHFDLISKLLKSNFYSRFQSDELAVCSTMLPRSRGIALRLLSVVMRG